MIAKDFVHVGHRTTSFTIYFSRLAILFQLCLAARRFEAKLR
jgi:hypothetical protein